LFLCLFCVFLFILRLYRGITTHHWLVVDDWWLGWLVTYHSLHHHVTPRTLTISGHTGIHSCVHYQLTYWLIEWLTDSLIDWFVYSLICLFVY
jgi:hypothetical protein